MRDHSGPEAASLGLHAAGVNFHVYIASRISSQKVKKIERNVLAEVKFYFIQEDRGDTRVYFVSCRDALNDIISHAYLSALYCTTITHPSSPLPTPYACSSR